MANSTQNSEEMSLLTSEDHSMLTRTKHTLFRAMTDFRNANELMESADGVNITWQDVEDTARYIDTFAGALQELYNMGDGGDKTPFYKLRLAISPVEITGASILPQELDPVVMTNLTETQRKLARQINLCRRVYLIGTGAIAEYGKFTQLVHDYFPGECSDVHMPMITLMISEDS